MQAGSGGHSGRIEKQLGLNLQEGGHEANMKRKLFTNHTEIQNKCN